MGKLSEEPTEEDKRRWEEDAFHQPEYTADANLWGRKAYWTADEATALSFGKSPDHIDLRVAEDHEGQLKFADEYICLHDLIEQAQEAGALPDPIPPRAFVSWADHQNFEVSQEIREVVAAREVEFADLERERDVLKARCEKLTQELQAAQYQLDKLRTAQPEKPDTTRDALDRDLNPKERTSLDTMLIAMAVIRYKHNPFGPKTTHKTSRIVDDVLLTGMRINAGTVHHHLERAARRLPDTFAESLRKPKPD